MILLKCYIYRINYWFSLQLDTDRDGRLNIRELKNHIKNYQCRDLPDYLGNHILRMSDDDSDGVLDFEEFYRLSLRQEWLFSRLVFNYCKMIVPRPNRERDETGKNENFHLKPNSMHTLLLLKKGVEFDGDGISFIPSCFSHTKLSRLAKIYL